jgi:hypothetical protein
VVTAFSFHDRIEFGQGNISKCLVKWASDETKCPHCAINFVTTAEIVRSCRQWSDFCDGVFRCCPHGPSGTCNKFKGGDYASLESHVTTCPHQKIRCQNDECGQMTEVLVHQYRERMRVYQW